MPMRSRPSRRHLSRKSKSSGAKQQQPQQDKLFELEGLPSDFGTTFQVQPCVMDNLSVSFGHSAGHFSSVKQSVRQIYQLLIAALCRHDPLPLIVRSAIKSKVLPASPPPPPPPSPLALRPSSPLEQTRTLSPHQPVFEQQQRSDIETIAALDIPHALRHFDFDLTVGNTSDTSGGMPTTLSAFATATAAIATKGGDICEPPVGSTISFSMARSEIRNQSDRRGVSVGACRQVADLLVGARVYGAVRKAVKEASAAALLQPPVKATTKSRRHHREYNIWINDGGLSCNTGLNYSDSGCEGGFIHATIFAPPNSAFDTSPTGSSKSSETGFTASSTTSASPRPSLRTTTTGLGALSLTAPPTVGLDGSNSNHASTQHMLHNSQQRSVSTDSVTATSVAGGRASRNGSVASGRSGAGRLCPLHADRTRAPSSESSCAVCASQHFLQRHLQRLAQETGALARLESTLSDCIQLQGNWRRSLNWVAGSVKDNRLPDSLRSLIRCICCNAVGCDTGCGQSVTVNPQIIISTDGHCNSLPYCRRLSSGAAGGGGHCCWESQPSGARDTV